jgi:hypothetical protein
MSTGRAAKQLVGFAILSLATRVLFLFYGLLNVDEGAHLVGGWTLLHGGGLYVRFADNKPPLIYLCYALAGLVGGSGIVAVRAFSDVLLVPSAALGIAAFYGYDRRGQLGGVAFVIASASLLAADAHAVNCELVMLPPLAWSVALLGRSPPRGLAALSGAGVLLGVSALGKQPTILCLPALLVLVCDRAASVPPHGGASLHPRWRACAPAFAVFTAGVATPLLAVYACFDARGAGSDFVYWTWRYHFLHVANPMSFADIVRRVATMGALVVPAAGLLVWPATRGWRISPVTLQRFFLAFIVATLLPAFLGARFFGHYFLPFLFALAIAAGPQLDRWASQPGTRAVRAWAISAMGVWLAFTIVNAMVYAPRNGLADVANPLYARVGDALRRDPCEPTGPAFVWGYAPSVYYESGRPPASRFVVPIDTITGYLAGNDAFDRGTMDTQGRIDATHWNWLMADLERSRPAVVADFSPTGLSHWDRFPLARFPRLQAWVAREYVRSATIDGVVIYRSKRCSSDARPADRLASPADVRP